MPSVSATKQRHQSETAFPRAHLYIHAVSAFSKNYVLILSRAVNACTNHRRIPVQGGTAFADVLSTVLVGEDGSVVLAGYTTGSWVDSNAGEEDYLVVKLDSDGNEVWVWQVRDRQNRPDLRRAFFVVSRLCIA